MAQPAKLPDWNTSATNRVEPTESEKAAGFVPGAVPTSGTFNWWMATVREWTSYLKNLAAEAFTWTGIHKFNNTVTLGNAAHTTFVNGPLATASTATIGGKLNANSGANVYGELYGEGHWQIGRATSEAGSDGGVHMEGPLTLQSATGYLATLTCNEDATFNQNVYANQGVFVPNTQEYKYSGGRVFRHFLLASDFLPSRADPQLWGSHWTTGPKDWGSFTTQVTFGAKLAIPNQVVIANAWVFLFNQSATQTYTVGAYINKHDYGSNTGGWGAAVASCSASIVLAPGASSWYPLTKTSPTLTDNGFGLAVIDMPGTAVAGDIRLRGMRVDYTMTNFRPAV